ncbi:hypothetical protein M9H77_12570 [Catharanthus roseus]|uniref:Uncharacterized protein n=1 Tax=Catharanthus roseus TaxID=4058 RepID=A0ACC0BHW6_CATRO|nr:hypothetical protein M9H77_12570 [Catharanthus roseus]
MGKLNPTTNGTVAPTVTDRLMPGGSFGANYIPCTVDPTLPSPVFVGSRFLTHLYHMEEVFQSLKRLEQQFSCLGKDVKHLKREEEVICEQNSIRDFGGPPMHDNQWGYGSFSSHASSYEHNFYDFYEGNIFGTRSDYNDISCERVPRNNDGKGRNYVNMDERFHKRKGDYGKYYDSYNYEGYNCGRSSQTLGTTSRPLSHKNLKFLFCVELLVHMIMKHGSYKGNNYSIHMLNVWWNCNCENRRRMRAQPIKTWSLMKQSSRNKFGIVNHVRQREVQPKVKFMESLMVEESLKIKELSQAKI